jgi:hypothetical protein
MKKDKLNKLLIKASRYIFDQYPLLKNFEFDTAAYEYQRSSSIELAFYTQISRVNNKVRDNLYHLEIDIILGNIRSLKKKMSKRHKKYSEIEAATLVLENLEKEHGKFTDWARELYNLDFIIFGNEKQRDKIGAEFVKIFPIKEFSEVSVVISRDGSVKYFPVKNKAD